MTRIRPPALRKGDVIGICAPASPPANPDDLRRGIAYLEGLGYRVEPGRHLLRRDGYLAGADRERAADVNRLFADRRVGAIVALRGGYGSMRILDAIDYAAVRRNPKIFVGYSDLTAMQMALWKKCRLVTFAGPMAAAGMARGLSGTAEELFWRMLTSRRAIGEVGGKLKGVEGGRSSRSGRGTGGLRMGSMRGVLLGGNLSMLSNLAGTPWLPSMRGAVVLLEDVGERPYRIDRMLRHLLLAGTFRGARGILLGAFTDCGPEKGKPSLRLPRIFSDTFGELGIPVAGGLKHGHIRGSLPLPVGLGVRLEVRRGEGRLVIPGAAVS